MAKTKKAAAPAVQQEARIEYKRLADIRPAKRNPKQHDIPKIVASIRRYGFRAPPLEDAATGRIAAGHGRKEAVEFIKAETPDVVPDGVKVAEDGEWMIPMVVGMAFASEAEAEEYLLADNRLVELGGWDDKVLAPMLARMAKRGDEAIAAIGYTTSEIDQLLARVTADSTAPDAFPSVSPGNVTVTYCCPKCSYKWSGQPDPAKKIGAKE